MKTNQLVQVRNNQVVTTSLQVAKVFGKEHYDVLRAIRNLDCSTDFIARNFAGYHYTSKLNPNVSRRLPMYYMTRDGFTFLVMGFTGKVAAQFKEDYINAFNRMEAALKSTTPNEREILQGMKNYFDHLRTQTKQFSVELQQQYHISLGLTDLCYSYSIDLNRSLKENIEMLLPVIQNTLIAGWHYACHAESNRQKAEEAVRMRNLLASVSAHIDGLGIRPEW